MKKSKKKFMVLHQFNKYHNFIKHKIYNKYSKHNKYSAHFKNYKVKVKVKKIWFKHVLIFTKKLFSIFIKDGLKFRIINIFLKIFNILKLKHYSAKNWFYLYFIQILKNILPFFSNISVFKKGVKLYKPNYIAKDKKFFKKLTTISCIWFKKGVSNRQEKTLLLRILSELESTRLKKSVSYNLKNDYYKNFYENKYLLKNFKKKWV